MDEGQGRPAAASDVRGILPAVVQIVALAQNRRGQLQPLWTGSGTVVERSGYILTNCHVAAPQEMGLPAQRADLLGVALTRRSDEPPALAYFCQVVVISPGLDLAVVKITHDTRGQPVGALTLPTVPLGDSDTLDLGDQVRIFGYPGIGGETITYTSGNVSGFAAEQGVGDRRAWIKTDATIAGGNSGGTAVDARGRLVGVPTRAGAGDATPVDARPVLDTNRDGRVDERDAPMAIGGFINSLRPINLARPLLEKALGGRLPAPAPLPREATQPSGGTPGFFNLLFGTQVADDGRVQTPVSVVPTGTPRLHAVFEFANMRRDLTWQHQWTRDGRPIGGSQPRRWDGPADGRRVLDIGQPGGLAAGSYHLTLAIDGRVALEGEVVVAAPETAAVTVSGRVIDAVTGRGVPDARIVVLRPGTTVATFLARNDRAAVLTHTMSGADGTFRLPDALPRDRAFGLIVAARDYTELTSDSGIAVSATAPTAMIVPPIALHPTKAPAQPAAPRTDIEPRLPRVTSGGSFGA